ncbi:MAG TPA: VOC family protein [Solirubrobacteraceae bacterium]|nr:VOC family protein [Solirubrobacteraceae bacterium]
MATQIVHIEIPAGRDAGAARGFWGALFGWQFTEMPGAPAEYFQTRINPEQGVAVSSIEPDRRGIRPYFEVDDIDAYIVRIAELRGEVYEKMGVPGSGWFALCRDPHGNQFGLWQTAPSAEPPQR